MTEQIRSAGERLASAFYQGDTAGFRDAAAATPFSEAWRLGEAADLTDAELVKRLVTLDIRAESLPALTLVPLIEVAWADDEMDVKERDAILAGAAQTGLAPDSLSYRMLESWTFERPDGTLFSAWEDFIRATNSELSDQERTHFQDRLVGFSRGVAAAAGGFLGLTSPISQSEQAVLDRVSAAFDG